MKRLLLVFFCVVAFSFSSFGVLVNVDLQYSNSSMGVSPGSIWAFYIAKSGYQIPSASGDYFSAHDSSTGYIDPYSVPGYDVDAFFHGEGQFELAQDGSVVASGVIDIDNWEKSHYPLAFIRVYSASNLLEQGDSFFTVSEPVAYYNGITLGSSLSNVALTNYVHYNPSVSPSFPAGPGGEDGDEFPVDTLVSSFSAVGLSILPNVVLVGLGFFALIALFLGIRYLLRASRRVR